MSRQIFPLYSKSAVDRAGKAIRGKTEQEHDVEIIENWRASHNYVLNTFQASLRNRTRNTEVVFAQRLKRKPTIFNKLIREDGMLLSRMHDIAGCRLIFKDQNDLRIFNKNFRSARFGHVLMSGDNRYDYISNPKKSGYRGLHDVYRYNVNSKGGEAWNGLLVEIQYRTTIQHAWATAVEIAGSITENSPKFNIGDERYIKFFQLSSEFLARTYEGQSSCFPELSIKSLREEITNLERDIGILKAFYALNVTTRQFKNTKYVILSNDSRSGRLSISNFDKYKLAIQSYQNMEKEYKNEDIVLVRSDSSDKIRTAFRNYFSDTRDFVRLMNNALNI